MTISHHFAEVNGVRLHYAAAGEGNGRLIVFAHGFPEFWYAWKEQLAEFGRDFHAVAPDLRGYNLSDKPDGIEHYAARLVAADLRALAEHLGYRSFTLVGHDWGGVVAWDCAIEHADALDRLVIVNAPHPAIFARELRQNPDQQRASAYIQLFRSPTAEASLAAANYRRLRDAILGDGLARGYFTEADQDAYLEAWSQPGALTGGLNYYRAIPSRPSGGYGVIGDEGAVPDRAVRVPTLVIWGERDTALLTGNLDGLADYVPDLTVRRIPDAGHWVVHEQPAVVNGYIREFVGGGA